jgi:hypothetical protein
MWIVTNRWPGFNNNKEMGPDMIFSKAERDIAFLLILMP